MAKPRLRTSLFHEHRVFILGSFIGASIGLAPFIIFTIYYIGPIIPQYSCSGPGMRYARDTVERLNDDLTFTIPDTSADIATRPLLPAPLAAGASDTRSLIAERAERLPTDERMNLITQRLIFTGQPEIDGWWMSHSKWNATIQCDNSNNEHCSQIFTTDCRKQMTTAIYQFLPIKDTSRIIGIDFTAKGATFSSFKWNDDSRKMDAAVVSSQALLKYTDESFEIVRLHFPTGNYSIMSAGLSKMFPAKKTLKSITSMLTCYGYDGSALFRDIEIKPIFDETVGMDVRKDRRKCVSKCPHYYKPKEYTLPFDVDLEIAVTDFQLKNSNLTMVTHLSIDRIDILQKSIAVWTGLMSVSVFVPVMDAKKVNQTEPLLTRSRRYLKDKLKEVQFKCKCDLLIIYARNVDDEYPTNYMRNLAIKQVKTEYMVLLDADFVPCPDFENRWFESMRKVKNKDPKKAYVVPVFEGNKQITAADLPITKTQLKKIVQAEEPVIFPFAYYSSPLSHELTNYTKWYKASEPYKLKGYEDVYEPYLVLNTKVTDMPLFDIRFSGYGFNKIQHTMELMYNDYTLHVLPNVWATHVYHRISQFKKQFLNGPLTRLENRIKRYEYVTEIMRKYRIGPCTDARL